MKRTGQKSRVAQAEQSKWLGQTIYGVKEITVLDRKEIFIRQYNNAAKEVQKTTIINNVVGASPDRILEGVCISGFMLIVVFRVCFDDNIAGFIPILGAFAMGAFKILPSISKVSSRINSIIFNQIGLESCYKNLKEAREIDAENIKRQNNIIKSIKKDTSDSINREKQIVFNNCLDIINISWKYKNSKENVLNDLSLRISKGDSVALIGASGAGKTTLADIILGLLEPQQGVVEMDGIDIFAIPHQWARIIGYVPQTVYLIDDTVRANVAFGLPQDCVDDEKIWRALEQAQLKGFVEELPKGLDTFVGERGVKFSGGQRQRIAIARALYENPDILVLDEATSALDTETETAVMESIDALQGSKTLIIVAHRLSTIRNCDKIYEIIDGRAILRNKEDVI